MNFQLRQYFVLAYASLFMRLVVSLDDFLSVSSELAVFKVLLDW